MGKLLKWEGAYNQVVSLFCRAVIQAPLLFGSYSWTMLYMMVRATESTHVGFLFQITGKWERQQSNRSWETPAAKEVLQIVGMQSVATYIGHRKVKVAQ